MLKRAKHWKATKWFRFGVPKKMRRKMGNRAYVKAKRGAKEVCEIMYREIITQALWHQARDLAIYGTSITDIYGNRIDPGEVNIETIMD
jgi:hypothetical protein